MSRPLSKVAADWWDFTTLDSEILQDAARLTAKDIQQLSRPGFQVHFYDTLEEFYLTEALEYVAAFRQSTADNPVGICGPIGPTEQLPLVARIINDLQLDVREGHFWGMDEWVQDGKSVTADHPLSFKKADLELCFNRIDRKLRMPDDHLRFPTGDLAKYSRTFDEVRCAVMQGGQGEVKHWAFNDPPKREGAYVDVPPPPEVYRRLGSKCRITSHDDYSKCANQRRRAGGVGADARGHRRPGRDMEVAARFHLASRNPRFSVWDPVDRLDDLQALT